MKLTARESRFIQSDVSQRRVIFSKQPFPDKLELYIALYAVERNPEAWFSEQMALESAFFGFAQESVQVKALKKTYIVAIMDWLVAYLKRHDCSEIPEQMRKDIAERLQAMYCIGHIPEGAYEDVVKRLDLEKYFKNCADLDLEVYKVRTRYY